MENLKNESGRSMVEMLGTLAIIGVLSIGGIAGYSYGIDKYLANATINDVNLRAVDLLSQLSQGHTPNLDSWETTSTTGYPISLNSDNAPTNYYIKVEQVPFEVCNMIADMMPENVEILVDNDTQACSEGYNILDFAYKGFEDTDKNENIGKKCSIFGCPECQECNTTTETCTAISDYKTKCTTNEGKSGWCVSGACTPDTTCNCDEGQYCADTNESCYNPIPSGTCKDAETQFKEVDIDGTMYYISSIQMSWWDAVSACEALGQKKLLNINELINDWDGSTLNNFTKTNLTEKLFKKIWDGNIEPWVWTANFYHNPHNNQYCSAYMIGFYGGSVNTDYRNYGTAERTIAVCK